MQRISRMLSFIIFVAFSLFAQERSRVGVLDFVAKNGVSEGDAEVIGELFRSELVASGAYDVLDRANMGTILEEQEFQQTGCTEAECAVQIGQMLNMEYMIYGSAMKLGDNIIISVGMVDIETSQIAKTAKKAFHSLNDAPGAIVAVVATLTGESTPDVTPPEPVVKTNTTKTTTDRPVKKPPKKTKRKYAKITSVEINRITGDAGNDEGIRYNKTYTVCEKHEREVLNLDTGIPETCP